jgi:hypothetical protein
MSQLTDIREKGFLVWGDATFCLVRKNRLMFLIGATPIARGHATYSNK